MTTVGTYLDTTQQANQHANEQLDAMLRVIGAVGCPPRSVLDVGAGDGVAAAAVASQFPVERLTLVDFSRPMLDRAASRFAGARAVDLIEADLRDPGWL